MKLFGSFFSILLCVLTLHGVEVRADEPAPLVIRVRPSKAAQPSDLPCDPLTPNSAPDGEPLTTGSIGNAKNISAAAGQFALDDVADFLGHCVDPDGQEDIAERKVIPQVLERMKEPGKYMGRRPTDGDYLKKMPAVRKLDNTMATKADWVAIDVVARTIFSEVASSPNCDDTSVKAVGRLIMNRADAARDARDKGKTPPYLYGKTIAGAHPLVPVVLAPHQFDVWAAKSEAKKWASCPATGHRKKYNFKDKSGQRHESSSGMKAYDNWLRALEVAADMVFREANFRKQTDSFKATQYTVNKVQEEKRLRECWHKSKDRLDGKLINNVQCMQAWIEPTPAEIKACAN